MKYRLKENPDKIPDVVSFRDNDARAFGYYKRKFYIGDSRGIYHQDLKPPLVREQFSYPGRLWLESKVISFWRYPKDFNTLKKIAKDIKNEIDVDILSNGWMIEIVLDDLYVSKGDRIVSGYLNYETKLIPTTEYKQSGKRSEEEMNIQHVLSPLQKSTKSVPKSLGSNKGSQSLEFQKKYTSESKVNTLKENPDKIKDIASFDDKDARTFGYHKNKFYITTSNGIYHHQLKPNFYRLDFKYPGRLWIDKKIISFWNTPYPENINVLKKIAKDIKNEINIDIFGKGWRIDYQTDLIPTTDYNRNKKTEEDESEEDMNIQHVLSPLQKSSKKVPYTKGNSTWKFQKKYTSENLIRKIVKEEIKKFKHDKKYKS